VLQLYVTERNLHKHNDTYNQTEGFEYMVFQTLERDIKNSSIEVMQAEAGT
jgi:hypothetical protein